MNRRIPGIPTPPVDNASFWGRNVSDFSINFNLFFLSSWKIHMVISPFSFPNFRVDFFFFNSYTVKIPFWWYPVLWFLTTAYSCVYNTQSFYFPPNPFVQSFCSQLIAKISNPDNHLPVSISIVFILPECQENAIGIWLH